MGDEADRLIEDGMASEAGLDDGYGPQEHELHGLRAGIDYLKR